MSLVPEEIGTRRALSDGDILVAEGDTDTSVYVLTKGALAVTLAGPNGPLEVHRSEVGELVGEIAALEQRPRTATVSAVGPAEVIEIESAAFKAWLQREPEKADTIAERSDQNTSATAVAKMAIDLLGDDAVDLIPELVEQADFVELRAGEVLFSEGDPADEAYFVLTGRIEITAEAESTAPAAGDRLLGSEFVGEVRGGEVLGEMSLMRRESRSATARAMRDTRLARCTLEGFETLLMNHPALMLSVARRMVTRAAKTNRSSDLGRSVTLVVTAPEQRETVASHFRGALEQLGNSIMLGSEQIDSVLGVDGIAQRRTGERGSARLAQLLTDTELKHNRIAYLADPTVTPWSEHALQMSDCIVLVASANPSSAERKLIGEFLDALPERSAPRWLALIEPTVRNPSSATRWRERPNFDEVHHARIGRAEDIERLARLAVGAGTGLVLSGGGARGFAHVGALRALQERGIVIDRIGGASMGAIFAAAAALLETEEEVVAEMSDQFDGLLDYTVPMVSLIKAQRITRNMTKLFGDTDIEDLWWPLYCVSTNLTQGRLEVHRSGRLVDAIRASSAIPAVMPPVAFGDDYYIDGGVLNNLPADIMAADQSISTVIAVDVAPPNGPTARSDYGLHLSGLKALRAALGRGRSPYPSLIPVLMRAMVAGSEGRRTASISDGTIDMYLPLNLTGVGLLAFERMQETIDRGHALAMPLIDKWLADRDTPDPVV